MSPTPAFSPGRCLCFPPPWVCCVVVALCVCADGGIPTRGVSLTWGGGDPCEGLPDHSNRAVIINVEVSSTRLHTHTYTHTLANSLLPEGFIVLFLFLQDGQPVADAFTLFLRSPLSVVACSLWDALLGCCVLVVVVGWQCDPNLAQPLIVSQKEHPTCVYNIWMKSKHGCPTQENGLSAGWHFIIWYPLCVRGCERV